MIKTNPLSVKDISLIAANIRKEYNINPEDAFPILDYLDDLFNKDLFSIQLLDDNDSYLDKNTPAVYNAVDNFIYLKESVLIEIEEGNYRSNFTLAHELFHYLQHQVLGFSFEEVEKRKTYEDPEWQANCFAGELLLPDEFLNNEDNEYLANHFQVSLECVLTRKVKHNKREMKEKGVIKFN